MGPDLDDDTIEMGTVTRRTALGPDPIPFGPPPPVRQRREAASLRHRVTVGGGDPIALDRPVLVGRRPRTPRIPDGPVPRLVAVASPTQEVSATHLEIRQVGAAVVARDLRSTNGSRIQLPVPGSAPRILAGGESLAVPTGTRIHLGDAVEIVVLAPGFAASPVSAPRNEVP